jgi:Raf kinase inhibitor-like YbhB/YbcL family protein
MRDIKRKIASIAVFMAVLAMLPAARAQAQETDNMLLSSPSFENGGVIPPQFTCRGENISPELSWSGAPPGTKSFALIADDPDAPHGIYTHWILYNIPPKRTGLEPDFPSLGGASGMTQGRNSFGNTGYGGPCPPVGDKPHRYSFRLFALDTVLDLNKDATKNDLEGAMTGHIVGQAELVGTFGIPVGH